MVDVIEQAGEHVDTILLPKVSCAGDAHVVATLLSQIEAALRLPHGRLRRPGGIPRAVLTKLEQIEARGQARPELAATG